MLKLIADRAYTLFELSSVNRALRLGGALHVWQVKCGMNRRTHVVVLWARIDGAFLGQADLLGRLVVADARRLVLRRRILSHVTRVARSLGA